MILPTIWEDFELPSKGLIYNKPDMGYRGRLRSLTTADELKRLSHTSTPYKVMCDMIENCLEKPLEVHVCDLCINDYQYLLHKLRLCTYGPDYKMNIVCPHCGKLSEVVANLDSLEVKQWDESMIDLQMVTLPITNVLVTLKYQTPRDLDIISYKNEEMKKKTKSNIDYSLIFTLMSVIDTIDGQKLDDYELREFVNKLPMKDTRTIIQACTKMLKSFGLDTEVNVKCKECGQDTIAPFRLSDEYFNPTSQN